MPVLLWIGAFNLALYYWIEKFLFTNYYVTPPQYNEKLIMKAVNTLPYALVLHAFMSIFTFWNGRIFLSEASIENEIAEIEGRHSMILGTSR